MPTYRDLEERSPLLDFPVWVLLLDSPPEETLSTEPGISSILVQLHWHIARLPKVGGALVNEPINKKTPKAETFSVRFPSQALHTSLGSFLVI